MSDKGGQSALRTAIGAIDVPRVLDHKPQIVLRGKFDSFLDISGRSRVDPDYRHVPLLARDAEGGVEVAALDGPVGKRVGLVVGVFGGTGLIRAPDAVVPAGEDVGAATGGRVVARGGGRDRMDQRLGDF